MLISIKLACFSIFLSIVETYPISCLIFLYNINDLYMEFRNKIDKMSEGMTEIQYSFLSMDMFT